MYECYQRRFSPSKSRERLTWATRKQDGKTIVIEIKQTCSTGEYYINHWEALSYVGRAQYCDQIVKDWLKNKYPSRYTGTWVNNYRTYLSLGAAYYTDPDSDYEILIWPENQKIGIISKNNTKEGSRSAFSIAVS